MKRYFVNPVLYTALGSTVIFASCKKDDNNAPTEDRKAMLIGTWNIMQTAHDDNKNGTPDPTEIHPVDSTAFNKETFHSDGTGILSVKTPDIDSSLNFTWSLMNSNQYLEVTLTGQPTATVKINNLTETDLQIENDQNPDGADWTYLKKK